jgi:hypothetical protein
VCQTYPWLRACLYTCTGVCSNISITQSMFIYIYQSVFRYTHGLIHVMYIYRSVFRYTYGCTHVYLLYQSVQIYPWLHACLCTHTAVCSKIPMSVCMFIYMYWSVFRCISGSMHVYLHISWCFIGLYHALW